MGRVKAGIGIFRIEKVELRHIAIPLKNKFTTSFGTKTERHSLLVSVTSSGITGYGECVSGSGPYYSSETIGTAWHILKDYLIPRLLETEGLQSPNETWELFEPIRGNNMAKASLEMAYWDLAAKAQGVSLAEMLGGKRDKVPVGVSVGIQGSPEELVDTVESFLTQGYKRIKLKIAPGRDYREVAAVRKAFPHTLLQVDANSAYTLQDRSLFERLDHLGLLLIEQPLADDDIIDHAKLQRGLQTPICLDESIHSPADAQHAIELGSCRVINIKPGRVGGHKQSKAIHDVCQESNVPVWCGGMLETNIGRAHNVALATLPNFRLPGDISESGRYFAEDIAEPNFELNSDSTISVPKGHGIGVTPIFKRINEVSQAHNVFVSSKSHK